MNISTTHKITYGKPPTPDYVGHFKVGAEQATKLAIDSAINPETTDLPVGAVALLGHDIIGEGVAMDQHTGKPHLHAEVVAMLDAKRTTDISPDAIVSTMEPCMQCLRAISEIPQIKHVGFIIPRIALETRGLVNPRTPISGHGLEIQQIDSYDLHAQNLVLFDNTRRDRETGHVTLNAVGIISALGALRRLN